MNAFQVIKTYFCKNQRDLMEVIKMELDDKDVTPDDILPMAKSARTKVMKTHKKDSVMAINRTFSVTKW